MHLTAKNLLFVSALCYVVPFALTTIVFAVAPPNYEAAPSALEITIGMMSMIGAWIGLIAFVLALVNWKK